MTEKKIEDIENVTVREWVSDYLKHRRAGDPVEQLIPQITSWSFVAWLVWYKGLDEDVAENVESNLREQFRWARLQGRLDRPSFAAIVAELLRLRRSTESLGAPPKPAPLSNGARTALERARWRPISEMHEDFGTCICIDINDPGAMWLGNHCSLDWDESRWTHFAQIPSLTNEQAEAMKAEATK